MPEYPFLADLCESHLIPSRNLLKQWKITKLAELCYLYFISLCILLATHTAQKWARAYCASTGEQNDFLTWRSNANDLYVMLYALSDDDSFAISSSVIRHWLRHVATHDDEADTHHFLMRIDNMFRISNSAMKSLRRTVTDWQDIDPSERRAVVIKLIQLIHDRAPSNSELLPPLKLLAATMRESASSGGTGAANVASAVGGLGAGFDPDEDWRSVYPKKPKPLVIKRRI